MTDIPVEVWPPEALARQRRLFAALGEAFPVRFVSGRPIEEETSLALTARMDRVGPLQRMRLLAATPSEAQADGAGVEFKSGSSVDRRLQGHSLIDGHAGAARPVPDDAGAAEVLAAHGRKPLWVRRRLAELDEFRVSATPKELGDGESLRDRLVENDFLGLVPIVQFLREVVGSNGWQEPPLRACILLDDPNLHRLSYGHVHFPELIQGAREHRYHVSLASIPIDHWYVSRAAAELFRENEDYVSLAIHGNNHVKGEFARAHDERARLRMLAQALCRTANLERRHGVPYSHVAVAPHELCAEETMATMMRLGFEALCLNEKVRAEDLLLADWEIVNFRAGGFPVIPRRPLSGSREELVLRAFVGQPIVLSGHHDDLSGGLDLLADLARFVNGFGNVRWCSLGDIARTNVLTAPREEATLATRLYSRRASVVVPHEVRLLSIELPKSHSKPAHESVELRTGASICNSPLIDGLAGPFPVRGGDSVTVTLKRNDSVDPQEVDKPLPNPWAVTRRILSELRDQTSPIVQAAGDIIRSRLPH